MSDIRVLVVDDSAFMRKMITDMIQHSEGMSVIDTARNGKQALDKIKSLNPDVVTLDVEMPELDGLAVLKEVMEFNPVPVIMLSSLTQKGTDTTIKSIEYGAVDFISKPSGSISLDIETVKNELIRKIYLAAKANLTVSTTTKQLQKPSDFTYNKNLIAIGVSTGGPKALQKVIGQLPENLSAPVIIIQHMPPSFTKSLAKRLDNLSALKVKEAENGEILENGTVYIAPGGKQLGVKRVGSVLSNQVLESPKNIRHVPSVDYTFETISHITGYNIINVILTGMGSDGVNGLKAIKQSQSSHYIIAESKDTAVIYGMPKSAIEQVGVHAVLPVGQIGRVLTNLVVKKGEG